MATSCCKLCLCRPHFVPPAAAIDAVFCCMPYHRNNLLFTVHGTGGVGELFFSIQASVVPMMDDDYRLPRRADRCRALHDGRRRHERTACRLEIETIVTVVRFRRLASETATIPVFCYLLYIVVKPMCHCMLATDSIRRSSTCDCSSLLQNRTDCLPTYLRTCGDVCARCHAAAIPVVLETARAVVPCHACHDCSSVPCCVCIFLFADDGDFDLQRHRAMMMFYPTVTCTKCL